MSSPIRQHHVPQLYLRNFAIKEKNSYMVNVVRKGQGKCFKANVEDIAVEKHFYTVNGLEDKYVWEKYYAIEIEPKMKAVLDSIISRCGSVVLSKEAKIINANEKALMSMILVFQMLRSKNCREYEEKLYKELAPEVIHKAKDIFPENAIGELDGIINQVIEDEDTFKSIVCSVSTDLERITKFASLMYGKTWLFYQLDKTKEFITSDNPVMFLNARTLDVTPFKNGLLDDDTVISFPISPKILLAMYSGNKYFGVMNSWDCQKYRLSGNKEVKFIDLHNRLQYEQCNKFVISNEKNALKKLV